jgi:hypothetical protein
MATRENEFVGDINEYLETVLKPAYTEVRRVESTLRAVLVELKLRAERGDGAADRIRTWLIEAIATCSMSVPDGLDETGTGRAMLAKLDGESAEEPE